MKLHLLDNGVLVLGSENPVVCDGGKGEGGESPRIPVHSFLLETSEGYVLFDCACDDHGMEVWPQWLRETPYVAGEGGTVVERLAELGVSPEDVRYVVLSHMHVDHMGCVKYFPGARTLVSAQEFTEVMREYSLNRLDGTFHVRTDIDNALRAGVQWRLVYEDRLPLAEDVTVYNFGAGHSYGMLGLLVRTGHGCYLLAADAVYSRAHYGPPARMAGVCSDEAGYYRTIERIRKIAEENQAEVLFGHDVEQFRSLAERNAQGEL